MIELHYMDALPLHPPPRSFESLSSYLMRLAEENAVSELRTFAKLMGITVGYGEHFGDYPHRFTRELILRTTCTESQLLATTLYYIGKKFGRSTQPNALSRFFNGSVGKYLRYCPLCLSESAYYSLTWRFLSLSGCHTHQCHLLDCCGNCKEPIPLFTIPSRVGICPTCGEDLRASHAEVLSEQEVQRVYQQIAELEFFLSPQHEQQASNHDNMARAIGAQFRKLRQERHDTKEHVAEILGIPVRSIASIEQGVKECNMLFQTYMRYAEYLEVTLQVTWTAALAEGPKTNKRTTYQKKDVHNSRLKQARRQQREEELLKKVQIVIEELKSLKQPVTITSISRLAQVSIPTLRMYPAVKAVLEQIADEREKQRQQREEEVVEQVQQAIVYLNNSEQVISVQAISECVHLSEPQLWRLPSVKALLKQVLGKKFARKQMDCGSEQIIVEQVQKVIAELKASGQTPSQEKICRGVGISLYKLLQYPLIKTLLKQVADEERLQRREQSRLRSQEVVERVQQAIEQLRALKLLVSRKAIGELVGLSPTALHRYAAVRPLLANVVEEYQQRAPQQREQEVMEQVRQAIRHLQENGQPITQRSIGNLIGLSDTALLYYPSVKRLYNQIREENQQTREQQAQQREEQLLAEIQNAMHQLSNQQERVTLRNISRLVGMSVTSLRKYPRINVLFGQIMANSHNRSKNDENNKSRENDHNECTLW